MLRITALAAACSLASAVAVGVSSIDARLSLCNPTATTQLWELGEAQSVKQVNGGACLDVEVRQAATLSSFG